MFAVLKFGAHYACDRDSPMVKDMTAPTSEHEPAIAGSQIVALFVVAMPRL